MIFATIGTQLGFPRLVTALVDLAPRLGEEMLIQTGPDTDPAWQAAAAATPGLTLVQSLRPAEFEEAFTRARAVVGHCGMGTILSARRWVKPLVVMPRRHALGEHRNDHQLATARQVEALPGVHVAWEIADLERLLAGPALSPPPEPGEQSPGQQALVARLRAFIEA
ncbi:glycosyltransferase [Frigidibacter sp. MR17.24]|uniref:glycosyltransferase n=1 Tax=Frigidibacter sp. MR17.24 TaxID=3127345 RepID=UPI003012CAB6